MLIEPLQRGSFLLRRVSRPAYVFQTEYFSDRLCECLTLGVQSKVRPGSSNGGEAAINRENPTHAVAGILRSQEQGDARQILRRS
jgi:hypothetical protein